MVHRFALYRERKAPRVQEVIDFKTHFTVLQLSQALRRFLADILAEITVPIFHAYTEKPCERAVKSRCKSQRIKTQSEEFSSFGRLISEIDRGTFTEGGGGSIRVLSPPGAVRSFPRLVSASENRSPSTQFDNGLVV